MRVRTRHQNEDLLRYPTRFRDKIIYKKKLFPRLMLQVLRGLIEKISPNNTYIQAGFGTSGSILLQSSH
ncbi:hypothetical protein CW304_13540 [Bacillus sp. UFRGS-B20]|nr:hypothetical protein CW304_13540 [Bacillus sp. UFRGS-B20]